MHIPDGMLDAKVAVATGAIAVVALGYSLKRLEKQLGERTTVLMGVMSAFVFAAQMVNFPVGPGVSGHLLGGVLAAVLLGPWAGVVVIGSVLIVQCFLFGDGGLTALGANFVNMGVIGAIGGYAIYAPIRRAVGGRAGVVFGAMAASWFAVLLASGACALELAASGRRTDFVRVLSWMALIHAGIGLGEALITGLVVRFVLLTRPDLIDEPKAEPSSASTRWGQTVLAGLAIALTVAVFFAPFACDAPDGLEYVGDKLGFLNEAAGSAVAAPLADYKLPMPSFQQMRVATSVVGVVGTLVVFGLGYGLARVFALRGDVILRSKRSEGRGEVSPDAA